MPPPLLSPPRSTWTVTAEEGAPPTPVEHNVEHAGALASVLAAAFVAAFVAAFTAAFATAFAEGGHSCTGAVDPALPAARALAGVQCCPQLRRRMASTIAGANTGDGAGERSTGAECGRYAREARR